MRKQTKFSRLIMAIAAVAALVGGYYIGNMNKHRVKAQPQIATALGEGRELKPFELKGKHDPVFNNEDLLGKWSFIYFGYTFCPDICPTTLTQFVQMSNRLAAETELRENSQFIMVSVDPARDTPERLDSYMTYFHPEFIGITGELAMIDKMAEDFGFYYKIHKPDENGNYPVDHTSTVYLINPEGKLAAVYSAIHNPKVAAEDFVLIARNYD